MSRLKKRQCFKFVGKVLLLGLTSCVLFTLIAACGFTQSGHNKYDKQFKYGQMLQDGRQFQNGRQFHEALQFQNGSLFQNGRQFHDGQKLQDARQFQDGQQFQDVGHFKNVRQFQNSKQFQDIQNISHNAIQLNHEKVINKSLPLGLRDRAILKHQKLSNKKKKFKSKHASLKDMSVNTASPKMAKLDDIFIGVKSGGVYHNKRLDLLLDTWVMKAKNETFIFTDTDDEEYAKRSDGHLINTHCGHDHSRKALCCKMGVMFDTYVKQNKRWFCHFDDDNYLIISNLLSYLGQYDADLDEIYAGFTQLQKPISTSDKKHPGRQFSFYFGTGGAGFCISKALTNRMIPFMCNGSFVDVCDRIRWPDDMAIGFIVEVLLNSSLTVEARFNSHIQALGNIRPENLDKQITLSYKIDKKFSNTVYLPKGVFNTTVDPTRLRSLHCMLYPDAKRCPKG